MRFVSDFMRLALLIVVLPALAVPVLSESFPSSSERWDSLPPSVMHQYLAESKAQGLADQRLARQLSLAQRPDDTQHNYDVLFYDVYLHVDESIYSIFGSVGFTAVATEDGVQEIQVDLYDNLSIDSIESTSGALSYTRESNVVTVTLDRAYSTGEQFEFVIGYHGQPEGVGNGAFDFYTYDGRTVIATHSEPYFGRAWWPSKDRPDDKPDSMNIALRVNRNFYAASNGTLDSVVDNTGWTHTFYYRVRYPIVTYLFSVAISDYWVWQQQYYYNEGADSMPIVHAVFPSLYSESLDTWGNTPEYMDVLSACFGPYPFINEKYGHANFTWGGGMEHQTMTSMGPTAFGTNITVHELAHSWWGNMITCESWHDIWINEGWASYAEAVYRLGTGSWTGYRNYMLLMDYEGGGTIWVPDTTDVSRIFHSGLSYDKGAWVVHMLRGLLGEELFAQGIEAYYNSELQYSSATTEELNDVWEQGTGVELDYFFDQWIYGTYRPHYFYYYASEPSDSGGYDTYLVIKQVQTTDPEVFTMPVDMLLWFPTTGEDTVVCFVEERKQLFKFNYPEPVDSVALDPAEWVMKYKTPRDWTIFITTLPGELSDGLLDIPYVDTVKAFGGSGERIFLALNGSLPDGLSIDSAGIISGIPGDTGLFTFDIHCYDLVTHYSHQVTFSIDVRLDWCCGRYTGGYTGNVNGSDDGAITLSDISLLIDHLYISRQDLDCPEAGNVNGSPDGLITLSDVSRLIDHLYISKEATAPCQY